MRARYGSLESADAIDSLESEADLLSSKVSTVTEVEYIAPSSVADPSPSGATTVASSAIDRIDASNVTYEPNELGGELQFVGDKISILDAMTHQWVAVPTPGNDTLLGTAGNDTIDGGEGDDVIYGLEGDDLLLGGNGNDFLFGGPPGFADRLEGGDGDDRLSANGVLFGDAGNDILLGGNGVDHLYGGEGNDWVDGGAGIDYVDGGAGNDKVIGSDGHDMLWGREGDDDLDGGDGFDTLSGGAGNDTLHGVNHADMLFGGAGDDVLHGDGRYGSNIYAGGDTIHGADVLFGEDGNDRLFGYGGDDQLYGGEGHDALNGGDGADYINGGAGADRMRGEAGRDVFVFTDRPFQGPAYFELDVIADFERSPPADGGDVIDMRALFDQYTNFTGTTAEEAANQGYLYFVQHGTPGQAGFGTTVYIDPNGNAPDPTTYYHYHDIAVVDLEGVAPGELGSYAPHYGGLSNHFLV